MIAFITIFCFFLVLKTSCLHFSHFPYYGFSYFWMNSLLLFCSWFFRLLVWAFLIFHIIVFLAFWMNICLCLALGSSKFLFALFSFAILSLSLNFGWIVLFLRQHECDTSSRAFRFLSKETCQSLAPAQFLRRTFILPKTAHIFLSATQCHFNCVSSGCIHRIRWLFGCGCPSTKFFWEFILVFENISWT